VHRGPHAAGNGKQPRLPAQNEVSAGNGIVWNPGCPGKDRLVRGLPHHAEGGDAMKRILLLNGNPNPKNDAFDSY
jgi:hypothetical protein